MSISKQTASTPLFYFNGYGIEASYSFSAYSNGTKESKTKKVCLDINFVHPTKEEPVTVRTIKSERILNQPEEVLGAIAQRDLKNFLVFSNMSLNGMSGSNN